MKKCIICGEEAKYLIKDTSDYYCKECSEENFGDLDYLQKIEESALKLKEIIKNKMENENSREE